MSTSSPLNSAWGTGKSLVQMWKEQEDESLHDDAAPQPWKPDRATENEVKEEVALSSVAATSNDDNESVSTEAASSSPPTEKATTSPFLASDAAELISQDSMGKHGAVSSSSFSSSVGCVVHVPPFWARLASSSVRFAGTADTLPASSTSTLPPSGSAGKGWMKTPPGPGTMLGKLMASRPDGASTGSSRSSSSPGKGGVQGLVRLTSSSTTGKEANGNGAAGKEKASPSANHHPLPPPADSRARKDRENTRSGNNGKGRGRDRRRDRRNGNLYGYALYSSSAVDWDSGHIPGGMFGAIPMEYHCAQVKNEAPSQGYEGPSLPFLPMGGAGPHPPYPQSFPFPHPPVRRVDPSIGYPCFGNPSILPYSIAARGPPPMGAPYLGPEVAH